MQEVTLYVLDCGVGEPSLFGKFAGLLTRVLNTGDSVITLDGARNVSSWRNVNCVFISFHNNNFIDFHKYIFA